MGMASKTKGGAGGERDHRGKQEMGRKETCKPGYEREWEMEEQWHSTTGMRKGNAEQASLSHSPPVKVSSLTESKEHEIRELGFKL